MFSTASAMVTSDFATVSTNGYRLHTTIRTMLKPIFAKSFWSLSVRRDRIPATYNSVCYSVSQINMSYHARHKAEMRVWGLGTGRIYSYYMWHNNVVCLCDITMWCVHRTFVHPRLALQRNTISLQFMSPATISS